MPNTYSYISYRTTKKGLLRKMKPMNRGQIAAALNPIIAENRGISLESAGHKKYLRSDEVLLFLEKMGEPILNFGKEIDLSTTRFSRAQLLSKIPAVPSKYFKITIITIVMQKRDIPFSKARYIKTLRTNEVLAFLLEIGEGVSVKWFGEV